MTEAGNVGHASTPRFCPDSPSLGQSCNRVACAWRTLFFLRSQTRQVSFALGRRCRRYSVCCQVELEVDETISVNAYRPHAASTGNERGALDGRLWLKPARSARAPKM
jgi:hypothetical protein